MNTIDDILTNVEGWLFPGEAAMLAKYARDVHRPAVIIEIGSFRGRSTIVMAHAVGYLGGPYLYAIDPHIMSEGDGYEFNDSDREAFTRNVLNSGFASRICPINLRSQDVAKIWNEPVGLLFVDGSHGYEDVQDDLAGWIPHITPDGYVALHDVNGPAIARAISERTDLVLVEQADITMVFSVRK